MKHFFLIIASFRHRYIVSLYLFIITNNEETMCRQFYSATSQKNDSLFKQGLT